ncbi:MAG TPA: cation-transporting P-type ATPase, partial [Geoalkalibacter subterraneus]|nr:cation-transporting P-type ATPase [Geoalkalibacter subterraneus]
MQGKEKLPEDVANPPWHTRKAEEVRQTLDVLEGGLSEQEAEKRLERYGPNQLPAPQRRGPLKRFFVQFHNLLIYVLLGAALVTALMGHWLDFGVILGVVVVNALIGFVQEGKAEKALDSIRGMLSLHAYVERNGHRREIDAEELVPGDLVLLQAGDKVPADLRLVSTKDLRVDEALLTGESQAVAKQVDPVGEDAVLGDRLSMAYSGTVVT